MNILTQKFVQQAQYRTFFTNKNGTLPAGYQGRNRLNPFRN